MNVVSTHALLKRLGMQKSPVTKLIRLGLVTPIRPGQFPIDTPGELARKLPTLRFLAGPLQLYGRTEYSSLSSPSLRSLSSTVSSGFAPESVFPNSCHPKPHCEDVTVRVQRQSR